MTETVATFFDATVKEPFPTENDRKKINPRSKIDFPVLKNLFRPEITVKMTVDF